jgi:hypothetical protein
MIRHYDHEYLLLFSPKWGVLWQSLLHSYVFFHKNPCYINVHSLFCSLFGGFTANSCRNKPIIFIMSVCLSTYNNSRTAEWIFMKFSIVLLSAHSNFGWNQTTVLGTLHDDLHVFYVWNTCVGVCQGVNISLTSTRYSGHADVTWSLCLNFFLFSGYLFNIFIF